MKKTSYVIFGCLALFFAWPLETTGSEMVDLRRIPLTGCLEASANSRGCLKETAIERKAISYDDLPGLVVPGNFIKHPSENELTYEAEGVFAEKITTVDLSEEVRKWLSLNFSSPPFNAREKWVQSAGNILAAFRDCRGNRAETEALLKRLQQQHPLIWAAASSFLSEWVKDDFLYSADWDPLKVENRKNGDNDGILERPPFPAMLPPPGRKIYQACAPVYAPLETIIAAEQNFQEYPGLTGVEYVSIAPVEGTVFEGVDDNGFPFLIYDLKLHQKPVPLVNLKFTLRQLLNYDAGRFQIADHLVEGDMNYFRQRIFFDPIRTTDNEVIGYVKTEWLDMDIKNLPDSGQDRQAGVRLDIGNMKLNAEKRRPSEK